VVPDRLLLLELPPNISKPEGLPPGQGRSFQSSHFLEGEKDGKGKTHNSVTFDPLVVGGRSRYCSKITRWSDPSTREEARKERERERNAQ
jgi:hypothetical protein